MKVDIVEAFEHRVLLTVEGDDFLRYRVIITAPELFGGRPHAVLPTTVFSRASWEAMKQGVDQGFEEFERRWPHGSRGP
jgi:hypothetical protein